MGGRENFVAPLLPDQEASLERACRVGLAPPGSVYIFSGVNAHSVCNVGFAAPGPDGAAPVPSLIISSYEAFVSINKQHAMTMVDKCMYRDDDGSSDDSESDDCILDFESDVAEAAVDIQRRLRGEGSEAVIKVDMARDTLEGLRSTNTKIGSRLEEDMDHGGCSDRKRPRKRDLQ